MKRVKITTDGFVWHVLTETEAVRELQDGGRGVFLLHDDDTGQPALYPYEIRAHIRRGGYAATEVGFINDQLN